VFLLWLAFSVSSVAEPQTTTQAARPQRTEAEARARAESNRREREAQRLKTGAPVELIPDYVKANIGPVPASLGVSPFYTKYADAMGIPVLPRRRYPTRRCSSPATSSTPCWRRDRWPSVLLLCFLCGWPSVFLLCFLCGWPSVFLLCFLCGWPSVFLLCFLCGWPSVFLLCFLCGSGRCSFRGRTRRMATASLRRSGRSARRTCG
jgi:hypothetical protein